MGINRNIVECKFERMTNEYSTALVLIETLWNVNLVLTIQMHEFEVLIETLWNVN